MGRGLSRNGWGAILHCGFSRDFSGGSIGKRSWYAYFSFDNNHVPQNNC